MIPTVGTIRKRPYDEFVESFGDDFKYVYLWMDFAHRLADESSAKRLKVGCVIATAGGGLYTGYNGTLKGDSNNCEEDGCTHGGVYHAEENALDKMLLDGVSPDGSIVVVTHSPCIVCARRILKASPKVVIYSDYYRDLEGKEFLEHHGIPCYDIDEIGTPLTPDYHL